MNQYSKHFSTHLMAVFTIGLFPAIAAEPQPAVAAPLTEAGNKLEATYTAMLKSLKEDVAKALPKIDESQPADNLKADLDQLLTSDKLDAQLVKLVLLSQATPSGLAGFAQQGPEQQSLVDKLLADAALMKQIVVAGGPVGGKYSETMKIYTDSVLRFSQGGENIKGMTIKDFTLTPATNATR